MWESPPKDKPSTYSAECKDLLQCLEVFPPQEDLYPFSIRNFLGTRVIAVLERTYSTDGYSNNSQPQSQPASLGANVLQALSPYEYFSPSN